MRATRRGLWADVPCAHNWVVRLPSKRPARNQRTSGFTILETMIAAVISMVCMGGVISACYILNRIQLDQDPKVRAHEAHLELLKANLITDVRSADAVFAFAGYLRLNGTALRLATWTTAASPDYPSLAGSAANVQAALAGGYALSGQTLTLVAAPAQQNASTLLCLRGDGRVTALWEIVNAEGSVGGISGVTTTIARYVDEGGATLQAAGVYEQFIAGATLASPGGTSGTRALAGAAAGTLGRVRITLPSPQTAGEILAISGGVKPESATADAIAVELQSLGRPAL